MRLKLRPKIRLALLLVPLIPVAAVAGEAVLSPLPDDAVVSGVLDNHPSVLTARARVGSAEPGAEALRKGPHEITVGGSYMRRDVAGGPSFNEFDVTVTRPFRLPGKAALDGQIGEYGITAADNMAEDAKHQAALMLNQQYWDWMTASAEARVDAQAVANLEATLKAVQRRVQLRDAAPLEADQTEAALGLARMVAQDSAGRADVARARLRAQFPDLPLPIQAPDVPAPVVADGELDAMRDEVIANSHEIAAAEASANRLDRVALRHKKDERADPSAGVRLFTERGGEEKGVGVVVSWPLGGGHRKAVTAGAASDATAAWADAAAVRRSVEEMADADRAEASFRYSSWQKARAMLDAQVAALLKMRRGYELGAIDLTDLLFAERQAHEAFRIEATARCDAWRALTRFRIDAHRIWIGD